MKRQQTLSLSIDKLKNFMPNHVDPRLTIPPEFPYNEHIPAADASASQPQQYANSTLQDHFSARQGYGNFGRMLGNKTPIRIAQRLQNNDVNSLPDASHYNGTDVDTHVVAQGEAHFLNVGSNQVKKGLATIGAGPCSILIAVVRDSGNKVRKIGMAHSDALVKKDGLDSFFSETKGHSNVEVTLLGGDLETASMAMKAADRAGASVVFSCANIGSRTDDDAIDAIVDTEGQVYNGMLTFTKIDDALMERMENADSRNVQLSISTS